MLKVELHTHTADDPLDRIPHSTTELIDRAADLGYDALAITLHDRQLDLATWSRHAAGRRIVLIPGIERTIEGKHVLLLNFSPRSELVRTFEDLARLRREERGLVIAPHAFFPGPTCLRRRLLDRHEDLFDAVEYNAMFTVGLDFNRPAERWATAHGKPMVGNGDVHRLSQLGSTYSLVDASRDATAICTAIREGRVQVEAQPLPWMTAVTVMSSLLAADVMQVVTPSRSPRDVVIEER